VDGRATVTHLDGSVCRWRRENRRRTNRTRTAALAIASSAAPRTRTRAALLPCCNINAAAHFHGISDLARIAAARRTPSRLRFFFLRTHCASLPPARITPRDLKLRRAPCRVWTSRRVCSSCGMLLSVYRRQRA